MEALLREYVARSVKFQLEAHEILSRHEAAKSSRVIVLSATYSKLGALNLRQDDLMRQALRCVENGLFRAAHVMGWAAFMDFLEEKFQSDGLVKLRRVRENWKGSTIEEMREFVPERQLVEVTKDLGLATKNEMGALVALLNRRNDCAHPSSFYPQLNETLGYLSELMQRISQLKDKTL